MHYAPAKTRLRLSLLAALFLIGSVAVRAILQFYPTPSRWWVISLLGAFSLFFFAGAIIHPRKTWQLSLYLAVQSLIILTLLLAFSPFDYFAALFTLLCVLAFWYLPERTAEIWSVLFIVFASTSLLISFGWKVGLEYVLTYMAVLLFTILLSIMTMRSEQAQNESQALLAELTQAHRQLQAYAEQVAELTSIKERNRLARDLHDSVTQTIFSLTLTAQATRVLLDRDPGRVAGQLDRLTLLAQSALAEMRGLIQQVHARTIAEDGLSTILKAHVAERQAKEGLTVDLHITGERRLPVETEEALFRVIQEALNNVVKHAHTDRAAVTVCLEHNPVQVTIEDGGVGFDSAYLPSQAIKEGNRKEVHMGLPGMADRIQALGGSLVIDSKPGKGTRIRVEINCTGEPKHA